MATATASTTTTNNPAASAPGADDNYAAGAATEPGSGDSASTAELTGTEPGSAAPASSATGSAGAASTDGAAALPDDSRLAEPLRAERQKQILEQQMELRERQMEEASAQRVAAVAAERDEAKAQVLQLRKDRLLERAFSQAEGRSGGDSRGTFFDIFKGQLGTCFRLGSGSDGGWRPTPRRSPALIRSVELPKPQGCSSDFKIRNPTAYLLRLPWRTASATTPPGGPLAGSDRWVPNAYASQSRPEVCRRRRRHNSAA